MSAERTGLRDRREPIAGGGRSIEPSPKRAHGLGRGTQPKQSPENPARFSSESIEELTEWLVANDANTRAMRSTRLRELLNILPVPSEGLSFLGGEESVICFNEVRRCYLDGSDLAVVLLCLAYVERELAAQLYAAGWENANKARLGAVLKMAHESGVLSKLEWNTYRELADLRNSHAHFRPPGSPTSLGLEPSRRMPRAPRCSRTTRDTRSRQWREL